MRVAMHVPCMHGMRTVMADPSKLKWPRHNFCPSATPKALALAQSRGCSPCLAAELRFVPLQLRARAAAVPPQLDGREAEGALVRALAARRF